MESELDASKKTSSNTSQNNSSNIPKTGPEEAILPIVALAVSVYLLAYNATLFKKNA
jgi:hypothetical protein